MGASKSMLFTEEQNHLAALAKAIAHPARVAILQHVLQTKACISNDLVSVIPLAQPTISQHLKELKKVGLLQGNIEGTSICYCINPEVLQFLCETLSQWNQLANQKTECK